MKNKISFLTFTFLIILLACSHKILAQKNSIQYTINGHQVEYNPLSISKAYSVTLNGPGKLLIRTRVRHNQNNTKSFSYGIAYTDNNSEKKYLATTNVKPVDSLVKINATSEKASKLKVFTINVPAGKHNYSFYMVKESPQIDIYTKFNPDPVVKWIDIQPINDTTRVFIKSDKANPQAYYRISNTIVKKYKIKGPASLRIISRLEYNYTMQGIISYRVLMNRNDTIIEMFKLSSEPSVETQYLFEKKYIPGTLTKFYIEIPSGVHICLFSLKDKHFSSLIRVSKKSKNK